MKKILILIGLITIAQYGFSQNIKPKMVISMTDLDSATWAKLKQLNFSVANVINCNNYPPTNTVAFTKYIQKVFPDDKATGIGVLDWEGTVFANLNGGDLTDTAYTNSLAKFVNAIKIAKQIRPNIKWGYFGIPFNPDGTSKKYNAALAPLLAECDIFFPGLYQHYSALTNNDNSVYVTQNITECLRLASIYKKKVMPFVWHRWYNDDKEYGLTVIPKNQFNQRISNILKTKYGGKGVDGVIWWGEDSFYYRKGYKNVAKGVPSNANFKDYYQNLIVDYAKFLNNANKN